MARNKYPEQTIEKILDVSYRLFREQGYEHTTIRDITDALGMSKGAVYHHFKSKEDILDKISDRYYHETGWFCDIRQDKFRNGLEKLRCIMTQMLSDQRKLDLDNLTMSLDKNPQLLALVLHSTMYDAPPMIQELVEEGIGDGSIHTAFPKELVETILLLFNIWIGIYTQSRDDFASKINFVKALTDNMGLPLFNDALLAIAHQYFDRIMAPD